MTIQLSLIICYNLTYNMVKGMIYVNPDLMLKVNLMSRNFSQLKEHFFWEGSIVKQFVAMTNAIKEKEVLPERLKEIIAFIKKETSWTSYFRGNNLFMMANLLGFEDDYRKLWMDMQFLYEKLRKSGFRNCAYLPLAAYTITKEVPKQNWDSSIVRMNGFYSSMKKNHFWLTSQDDYVYAAILAVSDLDLEETCLKIENCYNLLNSLGFSRGNYLQALSHILALGEESVQDKCHKALLIRNKLKENGCKLHYNSLSTLGLISLVATDINKIVADIKEVYDYIYNQPGFGFWSMSKDIRTMFAASLVCNSYIDDYQKGLLDITIGNSINAIIIAQQQAAMAAVIASSAAANSASSSSN